MSHAAESATAKGQLVVAGQAYPLKHALVYRPLEGGHGGAGELWVYVADAEITPEMARDELAMQIREKVAAQALHGVKLKIPVVAKKAKSDEIAGEVLASTHPGGSFNSSGGSLWDTLAVNGGHAAGKIRYVSEGNEFFNTPSWSLDVEFASPIAGASENPKELKGAEAQKSDQAAAYLAFYAAALKGLDAALPLMTPGRQAEVKMAMGQMGAEEFKKAFAQMPAQAPKGEALRKTIQTVLVDGDAAVLRAKTSPDATEVVPLQRIGGAWKVGQ